MNAWTEKSIKLANSENYLDKIDQIYKIQANPEREISPEDISAIERLHEKSDTVGLIKKFIELDKFPIDDPYIGCLRFPRVFSKNPKTVKRIGNRLIALDSGTLLTLCKQPKSSTRQLGHMFKHWIKTIGYPLLKEDEFDKFGGICILDGSDKTLENYANSNLGGELTKGIDLVIKIKPKKFLVGEAKFITTPGGTQTNQLDVALALAGKKFKNATAIAIVDGVVWFDKSYKDKIAKTNKHVLSALLLKDFIKSQ